MIVAIEQKKNRFLERFEIAIDGFLDNKYSAVEQFLEKRNSSYVDGITDKKEFLEVLKSLLHVPKRIFLFFPGTIILHFVGSYLAEFWLIVDKISLKPINIYFVIIFLIGIAFTTLGISNLSKLKNLAIPGSVMLVGLMSGVTGFFFKDSSVYPLLMSFFYPLAFTAPFFAKYIIELSEKNPDSE